MKKRTLGKRAAAFLLATTLLVGSTMTVFAEGTTDNEINNYVDDLDLSNEYVDSDKAQYHNNEAEKIEDNTKSIQDMEKLADAATDAATKAKKAVETVEAQVAEALNQEGLAEDAVDSLDTDKNKTTGQTVVEGATTAATEAETKVDKLNENIKQDIDEYNQKVVGTDGKSGTQGEVNEVAENIDTVKDAKGDVIVGTVTDSEGQDKNVTLEDYVDEQAKEAQKKAAEAKNKLEEALAVQVADDTLKVPDEVKDLVEDVVEAADLAKVAADNAGVAYQATIDNANKAIEEYNLVAMAYNKPLYGQFFVTYSKDQAKKKLAGTEYEYLLTDRKEIEGDIKDIKDTDLNEQEDIIEAAQTAVSTAETNFNNAKDAAEAAEKLAEDAKELVIGVDGTTGYAGTAITNADGAIDYYVTPAETKLTNKQNEKADKVNQIESLENTKAQQIQVKETAEKNAYNIGYKTYSTSKKTDLKKKMDEAYEAYDDCWGGWFITKANLKDKYNDAKKAYENYTADNLGINARESSQAVKTARSTVNQTQNQINTCNTELGNIKAQEKLAQTELDAAKTVRDNYLTEASNAAAEAAQKKFVEDLNGILADYSDQINQIDYDKDLNKWANDPLNTWHLIDKHRVRSEMDDQYNASTMQTIFNHLGISQWAVSTAEREKVMNAIKDAYKENIKLGYEKMATAEAAWAKADATAAKNTTNTEMDKIKDLATDITDLETRLGTAKTKVSDAQDTYDTAADDLKDLKDIVNNNKLSKVDLSNLQKEIWNAQQALFKASNELVEAKAAAAQAEGYKYWAEKLVKEHYTEVYTQAVQNADGNMVPNSNNDKNYDLTDKDVKMHNPKNFDQIESNQEIEVPYSIYKTYVNAMYDKYKELNFFTYGKGVSTGESMPTLYWELDKDGKLTGNFFDENADRPTGKYFVGYSFKNDLKTYRIDGVVQDYVKPAVPAPSASPVPSAAPAPSTEPGTPSGPATTDTVTIAAAPVALAAAPVAVADGPAVLGANRLRGNASDAAVLGATRGTDQAVLGKRRRPATGDNSSIYLWILALTAAVGVAAVSGTQIVKSKKKEQ